MNAVDIAHEYDARHLAASDDLRRKETVRTAYQGDLDVPLAELGQKEEATNANLLKQAVDQQGMRIASTQPDAYYPPDGTSDRAQRKAGERRKVTFGWWHYNDMRMIDRLRARWLVAYSDSAVIISPTGVDKPELGEAAERIPLWDPRDPLTVFPSDDSLTPEDCIFGSTQPFIHERRLYPFLGSVPEPDAQCELIEYHTAAEITTVATGTCYRNARSGTYEANYGRNEITYLSAGKNTWKWVATLSRVENRAGLCLVVNPGRISLAGAMGQYDGLIPMFRLQAAFWALHLHAMKRGIFTKEWIESPDGDGEVITAADPYDGTVGVVKGQIREHRLDPGFATTQTIDRLTFYMQQEGMIPSEWGGQSGPNIRTGRRGEQIMSAVVDFAVQEAQELMALSRQAENVRAAEVVKAWHGNKPVSFYVPTKGAKGQITYTPNDLFDSTHNVCAYSVSGADASRLEIGGMQRVGARTMARRSFMRNDPMVEDDEAEWDLMTDERLHDAQLAALEMGVQGGQYTPVQVARIRRWIRTNQKELDDAIIAIDEEMRAEQAEAVPADSPQAMPGLEGGADPGVTIPDTPPSLDNLAQMFRQSGTFQRAAS